MTTSSNDEHKESTIVFNKHSNAPSTRPKSHRCNEHLEDVLTGVSSWPMDFSKPFGVFWKCLRSQPGQEPPLYRNQFIAEESTEFVADEK
ncbi:hypothetical protein INT44_008831 [Umbelopsis vinacea]|uniref:Uncharacterized protein n=1 Tax=Umbelopsis vinacea TaxID=44442 RepID=A0A8H7Q1J2_9FUNG|nr:hypothetical protein INT44_008831 [Umbelopsis vinacea]KAI9285282.1 hypothetical protein BC943DRAFT_306209 [Umbelopsis sp. AD052]